MYFNKPWRAFAPSCGAIAITGQARVLFGLESLSRSVIAVVPPIQTLRAMGSDEGISTLFLVGAEAGAILVALGSALHADDAGLGLARRFGIRRVSVAAMTPIFAAQRNVADIAQAGLFAILPSFFPIQVVYLTLGAMLLGLAVLSTRIHARVGRPGADPLLNPGNSLEDKAS